MVKLSADAGINFIDTANVYSEGLSEQILAKFVSLQAYYTIEGRDLERGPD